VGVCYLYKIIILQKRLSLEGIQERYDKVIDISGEDFSLSSLVEKRKKEMKREH